MNLKLVLAPRLKPEEQRQVWAEAVETAPDGRITASHVERTVKKHRQQKLEKARDGYLKGANQVRTPCPQPQGRPQHNVGDLVVVHCNSFTANTQQKSHNNCIAVVVSVGNSGGTIKVETKWERVRYMRPPA